MSDDLKPCPFCGGEAYLRDDVSHSTAFFIGCSTVGCFGEIHWEQTAAEAIAAWNARTTPLAEALAVPQIKALVGAAKRALQFTENTESELGMTLESGDMLRAALRAIGEGRADG